jgi:uncharacterized protein YecE (DUF72 family)
MKRVRVGCSGWSYKDWRGAFYPEKLPQKDWLRHYSREFETVEINNTFYRLPSKSAVAGWVTETPRSFRFAVKASRYLTHIKRLRNAEVYIERFLSGIEELTSSKKLGAILWQLPPNFQRDDERLDEALSAIRARAPGRHAFEFRHPSWFVPDVYSLLRSHRAALVISDDPEMPFQAHELTTSWTYLRLHRGSRGRRGNYSALELEAWRRRIAAWRSRAEAYVYFNNDWEAFAVANARTLAASLS